MELTSSIIAYGPSLAVLGVPVTYVFLYLDRELGRHHSAFVTEREGDTGPKQIVYSTSTNTFTRNMANN